MAPPGEKAPGKAWLFFGHQREATDFFYRDELERSWRVRHADAAVDGLVARRRRKVYVQDRMREAGAELWAWLQDGRALLRLRRCQAHGQGRGDALVGIASARRPESEGGAKEFIAELKAPGRYQADVY